MDASHAIPSPAGRIQRFTRYHLFIVTIIALSIIFDGFDTYTLGLAIPSIAKEWGLKPSDFATITALATISTIAGSAFAGFVGDKIGRKRTLALATLLYGGGSLVSALSNEMMLLTLSRVVTGIGLGSAVVTAIVSVSEHVPLRQRAAAITLTTLGIPLGHTLAGITAAWVLEPLGWRTLFLIGAVIPAIMLVLQTIILPETPSFMRGKPRFAAALERYARRTDLDIEDLRTPPPPRKTSSGARFAELLSGRYRSDTIFMWLGMSASVFITHISSQWLPSLINHAGGSVTLASSALAYFGTGQILGAIVATPLIFWFGSRRPMLGGALAILTLSGLLMMNFDGHPTAYLTFAMLTAMAALGSMMVCLHHTLGPAIYHEDIRGSGTGVALALGKTGAVLSSYAGAWAVEQHGIAFFGLIALAAVVQFSCFGMIRRHAVGGRSTGNPASAA